MSDIKQYNRYERLFNLKALPFDIVVSGGILTETGWKLVGKFTKAELIEKYGENFVNRKFGGRVKFEECEYA